MQMNAKPICIATCEPNLLDRWAANQFNIVAAFPWNVATKCKKKIVTLIMHIDHYGRQSDEDFAPLHAKNWPGDRLMDQFPDQIKELFISRKGDDAPPRKDDPYFQDWLDEKWIPAFQTCEQDPSNRFLFTDGSHDTHEGVRSGAAWLVSDHGHKVAHGNFGCGIASSFDAKMLALARGLHAALTQVPDGITQITICGDNLSAL